MISELKKLFKNKFFINFSTSSIFMFLARYMDFAIIGWKITTLTNNPSSIGLLIFFRYLPLATSGIISGWLTDKFSRLNIIRVIIILVSVYYFLVSLYMLSGNNEIIVFYIFTFISGLLSSTDLASRQSYLSNVVNRKKLKLAIGLDIIIVNLCIFTGPNIAMYMYEFVDFYIIYIFLVIFTLSNLFLIRNNPKLSILKKHKEKYKGIIKGIEFSVSNKLVFSTLLILAIANFFAFSFESMAPYVGKNILNSSPREFSFLISMQGLGALLGSIIFFPVIIKISRPGLIFAFSTFALCFFSFLFSFNNSYLITCLIIFFGGVSISIFGNMHARILISQTPNPIRGRIQGLRQFCIGFFPVGSLLLGISGDYFGISNSIKFFSIIGFLGTISVLLFFRELRKKLNLYNE